MKDLDFIPFGAQYYRAPTPKQSHWEGDIKNFAAQGFNTLKIWAQWRWNNPKKDLYDFSDLKKIMDLAQENGVRVIINIIMDTAPVWFYQDYPDSVMVMNSGEKLVPQATPYRQIGGAPGPCYNHPAAQKYKEKFVLALSEAFADHPALLMWDLWNEPELTCGLKREPFNPNLVCYCDHCRDTFLHWLEEKYQTIENLNGAWEKNYLSFSDIELPHGPHVFQDMIDWRTFFTYVLRDDLRTRVKNVRAHDTAHPVMIHTVPSPYFNMVNSCCDDYLMAKECDLFGNSIGSDPFPAALSVCSAKGKQVLNAEIHAMGGTTFNRPSELSYDQLKKHIFVPFSMGVKGFLFWQYRPETLGLESPAWGMVDLEGKETPCTKYSQQINDLFLKERELVTAVRPVGSKIAIIKDNYNEVFDWCVDQSVTRAHYSLLGAFNGFYQAGYNVDVLTSDQLLEEDLSGYRLIYYPFPYYMKKETADGLRDWVAQGGTLVSEALFGSYQAEDGLHSEVCPGYGFDRVFSAKDVGVLSGAHFKNAYGENWSEADEAHQLTTLRLSFEGKDYQISGHFFEETFDVLDHGKVIGRFKNGKTAAVQSTYGKGKTVLLGSLIGYVYQISGQKEIRLFYDALAQFAGVEKEVVCTNAKIRADILPGGDRAILILNSSGEADASVKISLAEQHRYRMAEDTDRGAQYPISDGKLSLAVGKEEVKVLILS